MFRPHASDKATRHRGRGRICGACIRGGPPVRAAFPASTAAIRASARPRLDRSKRQPMTAVSPNAWVAATCFHTHFIKRSGQRRFDKSTALTPFFGFSRNPLRADFRPVQSRCRFSRAKAGIIPRSTRSSRKAIRARQSGITLLLRTVPAFSGVQRFASASQMQIRDRLQQQINHHAVAATSFIKTHS